MTPEQHEEVLLLQVFDQFDLGISKPEGAPIIWILAAAQKDAVESMRSLALVDPDNSARIRTLQNEIQRQIELKEWLSEAVVRGQEIYQRMNQSERAFVSEFVDDGESSNEVRED